MSVEKSKVCYTRHVDPKDNPPLQQVDLKGQRYSCNNVGAFLRRSALSCDKLHLHYHNQCWVGTPRSVPLSRQTWTEQSKNGGKSKRTLLAIGVPRSL